MHEVSTKGKVTYSGDTFIQIRNGKHDTSSAYTHAYNVRELFTSKLIERKPVLTMVTDGAADKAPRFPKTLSTAIDLFQMLNLNALIQQAFSFQPCRMQNGTFVSRSCGHYLTSRLFGDHMDSSGKMINEDLEKKNFFHAYEILSRIWSKTVIDGILVECEAVPLGNEHVPEDPDPEWVSRHVLQA